MKTFRASLVLDEVIIDYMEFETDTKRMALKYAEQRFEKAYPSYINICEILIIQLH